MAEDGFLLSKGTVDRLATVFTKVNGPSRFPSTGRVQNDNATHTRQVRLLAVETPEPSATAHMIGYTAEVLKVDYSTKQLVSTGITFDPDGDVEDFDIIKNYVYEVNKNADLVGKIFTATYRYVDDNEVSGIWVFSGASGGGGATWITTENVGLGFADGAQFDVPSGTGTALTSDNVYYIATPWNTRITAPSNHFGFFNQVGTDWYKPITEFSVKPTVNYPNGAGAGIETFTCYLNRSDLSLNLGGDAEFPAGVKVILDGFDNTVAGSSSLSYFNGKTFDARYDSDANIIYLISKDTF